MKRIGIFVVLSTLISVPALAGLTDCEKENLGKILAQEFRSIAATVAKAPKAERAEVAFREIEAFTKTEQFGYVGEATGMRELFDLAMSLPAACKDEVAKLGGYSKDAEAKFSRLRDLVSKGDWDSEARAHFDAHLEIERMALLTDCGSEMQSYVKQIGTEFAEATSAYLNALVDLIDAGQASKIPAEITTPSCKGDGK